MTSREHYQLTTEDMADPERAANRLNFFLSHIADRLDALEGLREAAIVRQPLRVKDSDENLIHSMGT